MVCANAIVLPSRPFLTGTSAAQNGPVIQICSKCGALLLEETDTCSFCDGPLVAEDSVVPQPVAVGASRQETEPEPEWRREVSRRLEEYRVRRRRLRPDDPQSGLPFIREPEFEEEILDSGTSAAAGESSSAPYRANGNSYSAGARFFEFARRSCSSANCAGSRGWSRGTSIGWCARRHLSSLYLCGDSWAFFVRLAEN